MDKSILNELLMYKVGFCKEYGIKSTFSRKMVDVGFNLLMAAIKWDKDPIRQKCVKKHILQAVSDDTFYFVDNVIYTKIFDLQAYADKHAERASLLADKDVGHPLWRKFKKLLKRSQ